MYFDKISFDLKFDLEFVTTYSYFPMNYCIKLKYIVHLNLYVSFITANFNK